MAQTDYLLLLIIALSMVGLSIITNPTPLLIWNVSPSVPTGLYVVWPGTVEKGQIAVVRLPESIAQFAHDRNYLPLGVPALKVVSADDGDHVCRKGLEVSVNGIYVATALKFDRLGRRMPIWSGCQRLADGEIFLLNPNPYSFDGRYFGVVQTKYAFGKARRIQ